MVHGKPFVNISSLLVEKQTLWSPYPTAAPDVLDLFCACPLSLHAHTSHLHLPAIHQTQINQTCPWTWLATTSMELSPWQQAASWCETTWKVKWKEICRKSQGHSWTYRGAGIRRKPIPLEKHRVGMQGQGRKFPERKVDSVFQGRGACSAQHQIPQCSAGSHKVFLFSWCRLCKQESSIQRLLLGGKSDRCSGSNTP